MNARERKTVKVDGLIWTVISRNERAVSHNGRHFFACRCNPKTLWLVDEINQAQVHHSRIIRTVGKCITKGLSAMVIAATTQAEAA